MLLNFQQIWKKGGVLLTNAVVSFECPFCSKSDCIPCLFQTMSEVKAIEYDKRVREYILTINLVSRS